MDKGEVIAQFLRLRRIGVVGVSRSGKEFGATAFRELVQHGYAVLPVNRESGNIDGFPFVPSVRDLKGKVEGILLVVPPNEAVAVIADAHAAGINHVWMQQGAESKEAIQFCRDHQILEVHGECLLMFLAHEKFPHSMHRVFRRLTGRLPRLPAAEPVA